MPTASRRQHTARNCSATITSSPPDHRRLEAGLARTASNGVPTIDYDNQARPAQAIDIGADQVSSGGAGGGGGAGFPALSLLDNFNRANANNLGNAWLQRVTGGNANANLRINNNQAIGNSAGNAYMPNAAGTPYGSKQGAAFTFTTSTSNGSSLLLKASGNYVNNPGYYAQAIRVRHNNNQVIVETTTNGTTFTQRGTLAGTFANGDTLTAVVDAAGLVSVWKTSGATNTLLGTVQLPITGNNAFTTGGGRIGLDLPTGARVDNFAGGNVP